MVRLVASYAGRPQWRMMPLLFAALGLPETLQALSVAELARSCHVNYLTTVSQLGRQLAINQYL
jgi:hypothetical protein